MSDTIFIHGVVIHARHGVMEHETEVGQRFVIDLELATDLSESSHTDKLADTVSYSDVVKTATSAFADDNYKLLERAAGAVADAVLGKFSRVNAVKVTVHKPHAPIAAIFGDVGVVLHAPAPKFMASVLIALGGNLGDVRDTFDKAIAAILDTADAKLLAASSDYETPPWGDTDQPRFINACIAIETQLAPHDLLARLQDIERTFGRNRQADRRNGPRTLDLDILAYDDLTLHDAALTLPHPRLFERAFVLVPLAEIAPDRMIGGTTARKALQGLDISGIRRL